jgi:hypothetical protein
VKLRALHLSVLAFTSATFFAATASAQGDAATSTNTTTDVTNATDATGGAAKSDSDEVPSFFNSRMATQPKDKTAKKAKEQLRWAGTQYFQQVGVTPDVFAPGLVQTYAPIVDTFILFQPRFSLTKDWQIRARMTGSFEFTNNANSSTTRAQTFQFGDVTPSLVYRGVPKFAGIKLLAAVGAALPTSQASQTRTMIVNPFLSATLDRQFEKVLGGDLELTFSTFYYHPFYQYTTPQADSTPQYMPQCFGAADTGCGLQSSGAENVENALSFLVSVSQTWGKWNPGAFFLLSNSWAYSLPPLAGVQPEPNGSTTFRQSSYLNVFLDYNVNDWFTGEIGYQMQRTILNGQSQIGNPIFDPYQDMRVYLGFNIVFDRLYEALQGKSNQAGIIRTKSERRPTLLF